MTPQKNQVSEVTSLLNEIQSEVSAENVSLLRFILRHANVIAGVFVGFLLLLAGTGIWQWRTGVKSAEAADELARITMTSHGEARVRALNSLVLSVPEKAKLGIYMALGQSALESGDYATASSAYAAAARQDSEGALGAAAMIAQACTLLKGGKNAEGVSLLQEMEKRLPEQARTVQLRQMLAEAAVGAGQTELAAKTYRDLAGMAPGRDGDYFRARAEELEPQGAANL
ncbi:MAG: hypothetical protein LBS77_04525 [Desulfovibrio sp.]|jgi:cytochrome c-type biogenesis protein CcmH/NrfG|nr:hypothetical protein [Desulfovibrio sp.]